MEKLPFQFNTDDIDIFRQLSTSHRMLGNLNGRLQGLPSPAIILNAVTLGEAKESSEIENIVTTYDALFKEMSAAITTPGSKEVLNYRTAILGGFSRLKQDGRNLITINDIKEIHNGIEPGTGDIRRLPGTVLENSRSGETVYTPPQNYHDILDYLRNLEIFINDDQVSDQDPLIKMALIHYQFESIHPFTDGNGRTGRILNILYLVKEGLLKEPILYLSKYINQNKMEYYQLLNAVHNHPEQIKGLILYLLKGIEQMSQFTLDFIDRIEAAMADMNEKLKGNQIIKARKDMVDLIFHNFYTKTDYLCEKLSISRGTASKYLRELERLGILEPVRAGKFILYKNNYLYDLMNDWN